MAKRYGPKNGRAVPLADYHQSKDNAAEYPATTTEKIITTNLPNIFSYRSYVFAKKPELIQRYVKATKADVGGVGGHVVAAEEVKGTITKFVLENNSYQGEPMFTSLMVTHTGDDVAVTGITTDAVGVNRSIGSIAAATAQTGVGVLIVGNVSAQGADYGTLKVTTRVLGFNSSKGCPLGNERWVRLAA